MPTSFHVRTLRVNVCSSRFQEKNYLKLSVQVYVNY